MTDEQYYSEVPFPDLLELPERLGRQDFLKWMENADLLSADGKKNIEEALTAIDKVNDDIPDEAMKWVAFTYESQHLPTPDGTGTLGRFFIYVPGVDFDRYFQFGVKVRDGKRRPYGLSVVSVQKNDASHQPLPRPEARFKDFWRLDEGGSVKVSTRLKESGEPLENCYECHKSAVLPITPKPESFDQERFADRVKKVNGFMGAYGAMDVHGIDVKDYGPAMGPRDFPGRTEAFFDVCAGRKNGVARSRYPVIASSMNCAKCHDGEGRGELNYPSLRRGLPLRSTMVERYVVTHRKMPLGAKSLAENERRAIVDCLKTEYYEGFDKVPALMELWLRQDGCWQKR
jgi:hypothetical protein